MVTFVLYCPLGTVVSLLLQSVATSQVEVRQLNGWIPPHVCGLCYSSVCCWSCQVRWCHFHLQLSLDQHDQPLTNTAATFVNQEGSHSSFLMQVK